MARDYNGRVVLITGAAGGLGSAFARRFAKAGARLGLLDLPGQGLDDLATEIEASGGQALALGADLTDPDQCRRAVEAVTGRWDRLDCLINNAGISHRSLFAQTEVEVIAKVMAVNFQGAVNVTKPALVKLIESRGQIVVISTVAGFAPLLGRTGYAAGKHALHGFFDTLRAELRSDGVSVTIVCPGFTRTPLVESALGGDGQPVRQEKVTVGRVAEPGEVAEAVFRAAARSRRLVVLTGTGKLSRLVVRLWPGLYERLMVKSVGPEFNLPTASKRPL